MSNHAYESVMKQVEANLAKKDSPESQANVAYALTKVGVIKANIEARRAEYEIEKNMSKEKIRSNENWRD